MMRFSPGAVVLVRFPFTRFRTAKKRPAVVISPSHYSLRQGDLVVLALTSQSQPGSVLSLQHWRFAGLLEPIWLCSPTTTACRSSAMHVSGG